MKKGGGGEIEASKGMSEKKRNILMKGTKNRKDKRQLEKKKKIK